MALFDKFKHKDDSDGANGAGGVKPEAEQNAGPIYVYSKEELSELDKYIQTAFGTYKEVIHELSSPDIHLDVCVVDPTEESPFYKLVTVGAGAYRMNVPEKYREWELEHAEYVICVPADWKLQCPGMNYYWPIKVLKDMARLPVWGNTWLAFGHTSQADEAGSPYASGTSFNSVVLDLAPSLDGEPAHVRLSSGKLLNFYQLIPLYPEELKFKMENNSEVLLDKLDELGIQYRVVDVNRKGIGRE